MNVSRIILLIQEEAAFFVSVLQMKKSKLGSSRAQPKVFVQLDVIPD